MHANAIAETLALNRQLQRGRLVNPINKNNRYDSVQDSVLTNKKFGQKHLLDEELAKEIPQLLY